ncbi:MAG: transposase [Caldilineaceae bacterium]
MNLLDYRYFYQRNLPHFQPPGATLFITFRLAGSIPVAILAQWKAEAQQVQRRLATIADPKARAEQTDLESRRWFGKWDMALDTAKVGPFWLRNARIAELVAGSLHYWAQQKYSLDTFCIMHNHVHVLLTPLRQANEQYYALQGIMHTIKRYTAREANRILHRSGQFWQEETFDHVVRDADELLRIRQYVVQNPVKAGLVKQWDEWPWSYANHA